MSMSFSTTQLRRILSNASPDLSIFWLARNPSSVAVISRMVASTPDGSVTFSV
jgi:hypothetical protein